MNREQIPLAEYRNLASRFSADRFDPDNLVRLIREWGARYAVLTTKHHDGFCLYESALTDFSSPNSAAKRDLVGEFINACRKHGIKIGLYYSLNDWSTSPDAVDALEHPETCYQPFIEYVHGQIRELMTNYGKIDILWYDGWWPYDAGGWQAEKLNRMVRSLQPGILVNSRCGLPGDFATPEGHIPAMDGAWEACMTLNNNWGYHKGDNNWKSAKDVAFMLQEVAAQDGNLLMNIGLRGDGSIPEQYNDILGKVGAWCKQNGEAVFGTERFVYDLRERKSDRSDISPHGFYTARGNNFYLHMHSWPGSVFAISGLECNVEKVTNLADGTEYQFEQSNGIIQLLGLPENYDTSMPVVLHFKTKDKPCIYRTGGYRNPTVPHCRYDPLVSDIS